MQTQQMIEVKHGGATILLPHATIVKNWLATLPGHANDNPDQIPAIGEVWPEQGGIYAGMVRGSNGLPDYHLIAAHPQEEKKLEWGTAGIEVSGADHEWDGLANTIALAEDGHDHPAADWAHQLNLNGRNDWYLPARRELSLLYANVPELFDKVWHWSSTQYSAITAWSQYFGDGFQDTGLKGNAFRARAVRRFISHSTL
ncbi:MAG: DUF1566 domain-containing protein [Pseudomonadales bacterium]|nr:DUF1566 domain-containing protein [Pseudomonadales bacterium]